MVLLMTTNTRTGRPNASTRARIVATLDAAMGLSCKACGRDTIKGGPTTDGRTLNMGHIVADCNGGTWNISNLLPLCRRCNVYMEGTDWADCGAPMLATPLPAGTKLLPDTRDEHNYMEAPPWA